MAALVGVVRATRLHKVLPAFLVVMNSTLLAGGTPSVDRIVASGLFLLSVSAAGMQINALTDVELDRRQHPERMRWLTGDPTVLVAVFGAEAMVAAGSLVWMVMMGARALACAAVAYGFFLTLYSYNFLAPRQGVQTRLKVFWWGNLLTVLGAYAALWIVGLAMASPSAATLPRWYLLAAFVCVVDYGMFVNDCAKDADAERAHGLRTLPALLGAVSCSRVAVALTCLGALGAAVCAAQVLHGAHAAALALYLAVQTVSAVFVMTMAPGRESRREQWVDASFWASRLGMLLLLLLAGG